MKRSGVTIALAALAMVSLAACGTPAANTQPTAAPTATTVSQSANTDQSANPPAVATQPSGMQGMTETPASDGNGSSSVPSAAPTTPAAAVAPTADSDAQVNDLQPSSVTQVQGNLREWAIDLSQSTVPAGKVQFTVTNESMMGHNFTVKDASGNTVGGTRTFSNSEGPQTFTVELQPGTYTIICTLPGHAQRGQRAELTVK